MKNALIIGSEGQDGTLLKIFLGEKGYKVFGVGRTVPIGATPQTEYLQFDFIKDSFSIFEKYIIHVNPQEIYYVAAYHQSSQEFSGGDMNSIDNSVLVNQTGFIKVLEVCKNHGLKSRIVYTSSSLIFSGSEEMIQTEETVVAPRCIYSLTKCAAMDAARHYRISFGLFVSVAIMYNHESKFRSDNFLSKIIVNETKKLVQGEIKSIQIGDLSAMTDWGYAFDYVEALWHILQLNRPDNFIVSSNVAHKVQDWFEVLFEYLNLDWTKYVSEDATRIYRKKPTLIGNHAKLVSTGWFPRTSFKEMVIKMYNNSI